jgi:hypothetical protein
VDAKDWTGAVERFKRRGAPSRTPMCRIHRLLVSEPEELRSRSLTTSARSSSTRATAAPRYIGETYLLVGDVAGAERHLKALREICLLGCEEMKDLEQAITKYRARAEAPRRARGRNAVGSFFLSSLPV